MTMTIGEKFRAETEVGGIDSVQATFTITEIRKSGIIVADGIVDDTTARGRPYFGTRHRHDSRFKANPKKARDGRLAEFQPCIRPGWVQVNEGG